MVQHVGTLFDGLLAPVGVACPALADELILERLLGRFVATGRGNACHLIRAQHVQLDAGRAVAHLLREIRCDVFASAGGYSIGAILLVNHGAHTALHLTAEDVTLEDGVADLMARNVAGCHLV